MALTNAGRPRSRRLVVCGNCSLVVTLNNLSTHWKRHPEELGQRRFTELPGEASEPAPSRLPAIVEAPAPPELDLSSITADEIALGVVESQAGGPIPVELLASVVAYVDATRSLVAELRSLRSS